MFNPILLFSLLWISNISLHLVFSNMFIEFDPVLWLILALAFFGFYSGAFIAKRYVPIKQARTNKVLRRSGEKNLFIVTSLTIYLVGAVLVISYGYNTILGMTGGEINLIKIREILIRDFIGERNLFGLVRYFFLGTFLCLYCLSLSRDLSNWKIFLILLLGFTSAIMTTGRLSLLLFSIGSAVVLYRYGKVNRAHLFVFATLFLVLFLAIALALGKGGDGMSVTESVLWNLQVYVMSSLSCFNGFVAEQSKDIASSLLLPNTVRNFWAYLWGEMALQKPDLYPFRFVPFACNTYTVLFPIYHDFHFFGILGFFLLLGGLHWYLYENFRQKNASETWIYFYAVSLYPLAMNIFEDAYFSSPGLWVLMLTPVLINKLLSRARKTIQGTQYE